MNGIPRRTVVLGCVGVVVLAVASWLIGVNWVYCLIIAGLAVAAGAATNLPGFGAVPFWPPVDTKMRSGRRSEVANLSWSLPGRRRTTDRGVAARLQVIATNRLHRHGIDLATTTGRHQATALLGPDVVAALAPESSLQLNNRQLSKCIEALEKLGPDRSPAQQRTTWSSNR